MFKNSSKILFIIILIMSTIISVSSNSWIGSWCGLEINLLVFIPLMTQMKNLMSNESSLKYFLIQALASSILMFGIMMNMFKTNFIFEMNFNILSTTIIISALLLKSGAAPFHFWFPAVMEGLSWINSLILMTWQKIAPLMLISYIMIKPLLEFTVILSVLIGSLGGLNQTSLRKLMAFSSINHIGWMLAAMMSSESLWMMYFIMYSFLSSTLIFMFNLMKTFHFNQLFSMYMPSKPLKFSLFLSLLSLGGLPPFLGFYPKWMVIQQMVINNQYPMILFMVTLTLITLFYYLRICYTAFMLNNYEINWMTNYFINKSYLINCLIMAFISISGLIIINLIYFLV